MFDAVKERDNIVRFVRDYYRKNHLKGAVLGISGGKDSGVVAGLLCEAIGAENVVGITMYIAKNYTTNQHNNYNAKSSDIFNNGCISTFFLFY